MQYFDYQKTSLSESAIIEASAGSGKTYTIVEIVLRLLSEKKIPIENILLITFTNKAADEMKSRLRKRIQQEIASHTLSLAIKEIYQINLSHFDNASIQTIHSFCQKTLLEYNTETGLYNSLQISQDTKIEEEAIYDYFRELNESKTIREKLFYLSLVHTISHIPFKPNTKQYDKVIFDYLVNFYLELLLKKKFVSYYYQTHLIDLNENQLETKESDYQQLELWMENWNNDSNSIFKAIKTVEYEINLIGGLSSFYQSFKDKECLNIKYSKKYPDRMKELFWVLKSNDLFEFFLRFYVSKESMEMLCKEKIDINTKKNSTLIYPRLYEKISYLFKIYQKYQKTIFHLGMTFLKESLITIQKKINLEKIKQCQFNFDDIIEFLYNALSSESSQTICSTLQEKYKIVIIDEFQDTDPLQWELLQKAFTKDTLFFLIGDPKQSIYSFRGSDLNTYFQAKSTISTHRHFSLNFNYRSNKNLIKGFNVFFQSLFNQSKDSSLQQDQKSNLKISNENPFSLQYIDTKYPNDSKNQSEVKNPFRFILLDGKTRDQLKKNFIQQVVPEINKHIQLGNTYNDMAIIVRDNNSVQKFVYYLEQSNIPTYATAKANEHFSIWHTVDAKNLIILLEGIIEYRSMNFIKRTMMSYFFDFTYSDIIYLDKNDELGFFINQLENWRQLFFEKGFFHLIKSVLSYSTHIYYFSPDTNDIIDKNIDSFETRMLRYPNGIRSLTNINHLIELVSSHVNLEYSSLSSLINYIKKQQKENIQENSYLRIESEKEKLGIYTIHESKGMEYPIVFFYSEQKKDPSPSYIVLNENKEKYFSFLSQSTLQKKWKKQESLEQHRLSYVAITRAKNYLYFPLLKDIKLIDKIPHSTIIQNNQSNDVSHSISGETKKLDSKTLIEPEHINYKNLQNRYLKINSYSKIIQNYLDHDNINHSNDFLIEQETIYNFSAGKDFGNLIHAILEDRSFSFTAYGQNNNLEKLKNNQLIIKRKCYSFFSIQWYSQYHSLLNEIIKNTLTANIQIISKHNSFTLNQLKSCNRNHELELFYPIKNNDSLKFPQNNKKQSNKIFYINKNGYLKGFVDLIFEFNNQFFIADWKTNKLGNTLGDYNEDKIKDAMEKHFYHLQYYFYLTGIYIHWINQQNHFNSSKPIPINELIQQFNLSFGGIFYFFVRGMKENNQSYFFARPTYKKFSQFAKSILSKDLFQRYFI